jgi:ATP-dependent Clp protease adaptor protein ClpS
MTDGSEMPDKHKVGTLFRLLASAVAVCGVVAIAANVYNLLDRGLADVRWLDGLMFLGMLWLTLTMAWVACVGRAPAWPGFLWADSKPRRESPLFDPETRLVDRDGFVAPDAEFGIEMLNDATTPMDFVVDQLMAHVGLPKNEAVQAMLRIHTQGGALLALPGEAQARDAATRITDAARAAQFPLVCRFVDFRRRRS